MRKAAKVVDLGPRYDQAEGRSSVVPLEERQGEHQSTRLSLREGWRLVRTPSSENGIYEYYRVLLDRPPEPEALLESMRSLHVGGSMRFELLAAIATSEEARRRGVSGPGLLLIRLVAVAARRSGMARRVKRRRFHRAVTDMLERGVTVVGPSAPAFDPSPLEHRIDELVQDRSRGGSSPSEEVADLADRVAALESAMLELLNARARELRGRSEGGRAAAAE